MSVKHSKAAPVEKSDRTKAASVKKTEHSKSASVESVEQLNSDVSVSIKKEKVREETERMKTEVFRRNQRTRSAPSNP